MFKNILCIYFIVLFVVVNTRPESSNRQKLKKLNNDLQPNPVAIELGENDSYYPKMQEEKFFELMPSISYENVRRKYPILGFNKDNVIDYEYDYDTKPEDTHDALSTRILYL